MIPRPILVTVCLSALLMSGLTPASAGEIHVEDPWVREAPPIQAPQAGYLSLHNASDESAVLISVKSPAFRAIEFHRTEERDGVARMLRQERISIAAGEKVHFQPGGLHLMMFGAQRHLRAGEHIELQLEFANGLRLRANAEVRDSAPDAHHHH